MTRTPLEAGRRGIHKLARIPPIPAPGRRMDARGRTRWWSLGGRVGFVIRARRSPEFRAPGWGALGAVPRRGRGPSSPLSRSVTCLESRSLLQFVRLPATTPHLFLTRSCVPSSCKSTRYRIQSLSSATELSRVGGAIKWQKRVRESYVNAGAGRVPRRVDRR